MRLEEKSMHYSDRKQATSKNTRENILNAKASNKAHVQACIPHAVEAEMWGT